MAKTEAPKVPISREVWSMEWRTGSYLEWCCHGLFEQEADALRWCAAQQKAEPGIEFRVISRLVKSPSYCALFEKPLRRNDGSS